MGFHIHKTLSCPDWDVHIMQTLAIFLILLGIFQTKPICQANARQSKPGPGNVNRGKQNQPSPDSRRGTDRSNGHRQCLAADLQISSRSRWVLDIYRPPRPPPSCKSGNPEILESGNPEI